MIVLIHIPMNNTWDNVVNTYEGVFNESKIETEQLDLELDKFFADLEAQLDESEVARPAQAVLDRHTKDRSNLDNKILSDFHGHAPTIDDTFKGKLPTLTPKAQIFITQNLQQGQYFRLGIEGGGCSGFNYLLDIAEEVEEHDIIFVSLLLRWLMI